MTTCGVVVGATIKLLGRGREVKVFVPVGSWEYCAMLVVLVDAVEEVETAGTEGSELSDGLGVDSSPEPLLTDSDAGRLDG